MVVEIVEVKELAKYCAVYWCVVWVLYIFACVELEHEVQERYEDDKKWDCCEDEDGEEGFHIPIRVAKNLEHFIVDGNIIYMSWKMLEVTLLRVK